MSSGGNPLARHGGVSYLQIPAVDPRVSSAFYAELFGWQIDPRGGDDFRFSEPGGLLIGRWVTDRAPAPEAGFVPYIYVNDVDRVVAAVAGKGGAVVEAPRAEGDVLIARVRDPAGNLVGVWQFAGARPTLE